MENIMGKRIEQKRKEMKMTMKELADILGVKDSAINKYEKGMVENLKRSTIKKMSEIFDCSPAWLMGFENEVEEAPIPTFSLEHLNLVALYSQLTKEEQELIISTMSKFVASHKSE